MSVTVSVNNTSYSIPQTNETGWGDNVTSWIQAVSSSTLQKNGGTFTLTAEVDFGATYGLKLAYVKSQGTNVSSVGILRLANAESIGWRNAANGADKLLSVDSSDRLTYAGSVLASSAGVVPATAGGTGTTSYAVGDLLYADTTTTLAKLSAGTSGTFLKSNGAGVAPSYASASGVLAIQSKTANYTVLTTDDVIFANADGASSFTLTLYAASGNSGKVLRIKKTGSDVTKTITIDGNGSETIDGSTTYVLYTLGEELEIICDGSNWQVLNHKTITNWVAYTPTGNMTTNVTYTGFWRRNGDSMEVTARGTFSGATDATTMSLNTPSGSTIDTAKYLSTGQAQSLGVANMFDSSASFGYTGVVGQNGTDEVLFWGFNSGTWTNTVPFTIATGDTITANFTVPISGWKA